MRRLDRRYVVPLSTVVVTLSIVLSTAQASSPGFKYIRSFGSGNGMQSGPGQLSTPQGIAVVPSSGDVLVADNMNNRIQEFKPSGKFVRAFGSQGSNPGQFNGPMGLGLGPKGEIYVADSSNGRVEEFSSSREYVRSFGTFTNSPNALAVAPNGDVFVADGPFIRHFTGTGAALSSFGGSGVGKGRFNTTIGGLAVSPSGYLFATDYSGGRVEEFTANGKYMRSLANSGKAAVLGGIGIAVSRTSIFVSDNGHQRAIQLHLDGSFLRAFATKNPGKLVYPGPAGTDCAGLAYIADLDVGRVREYGRASASHPGCR